MKNDSTKSCHVGTWVLRCLLCVIAFHAVASARPLTTIMPGDESSERDAGLVANAAPVESKPDVALGLPARRLVPPREDQPASIAFDVRLDPEHQNYITLALWGGDSTWTPVNLLTDLDSVNLGNVWWHVTREPPVPGRFLLRTFPIPIEVTRGKTSIRLRLETAPAPQNIGAFRNADQPPPPMSYRPSFAIHGIYTHVDPWLDPPDALTRAKPFEWGRPAARPADFPATIEDRLLERARVDIQRSLDHNVVRSQYGTGHRFDTRVLTALATIYHTEWSGHFQEQKIAERIRDAIDTHALRQASLGGDAGAMFYRGWGSHGRIAYAYSRMHDAFQQLGWLDQTIDVPTPSGSQKLSRRHLYRDFFHDAFVWRKQDRRSFTNQPIYVAHTLYRLQTALRALGDSRAMTPAHAVRYVHEALGITPLRSREFAIESADAGYPYFLITRAGLTRERGYVDAYGELGHVIMPLVEETQDPLVRELAERFIRTRSIFRVPTNDVDGHRALRGIGAISWRGATFPFRIAYAGIPEAATLADPVSLRLAQLEIEHGRLHLLTPAPDRNAHWEPQASIDLVEQYRKVIGMPPSSYRLPTEPDQPDFVWSDPENGVFVFRHGPRIVFGSFWNIDAFNGRAVGERAIYHLIEPSHERLVEFPTTYQLPPSGLSVTVVHPFGTRTSPQVPPPPGMQRWQEEPAVAMDHRVGRAYFYHARIGPYVIAMNTTETGTYRESTWQLPAIPNAHAARDLATGQIVDLSHGLDVPSYTTRVFILDEHE